MQTTFAVPFDPFQGAQAAPDQDPVLDLFKAWKAASDEYNGGRDEGGWREENALRRAEATPATTAAGVASRLEMALEYADFDPQTTDPEDLPWSLILLAIRELKSGKIGGEI